jgi:hypothetical protein
MAAVVLGGTLWTGSALSQGEQPTEFSEYVWPADYSREQQAEALHELLENRKADLARIEEDLLRFPEDSFEAAQLREKASALKEYIASLESYLADRG